MGNTAFDFRQLIKYKLRACSWQIIEIAYYTLHTQSCKLSNSYNLHKRFIVATVYSDVKIIRQKTNTLTTKDAILRFVMSADISQRHNVGGFLMANLRNQPFICFDELAQDPGISENNVNEKRNIVLLVPCSHTIIMKSQYYVFGAQAST